MIKVYNILLIWVFFTVVGGRQLSGFTIIERMNLKLYHVFFLIFLSYVLLNYNKIKLPSKKLYILYFIFGTIAMINGLIKGHDVFIKYEIIYYPVYAFLAYGVVNNIKKYDKLISVFVISWIIRVIIVEIIFQVNGSSIFFSFDNLRFVSSIRQSSDIINTGAFCVLILMISKLFKRNYFGNKYINYIVIILSVFIMIRYDVRSTIVAITGIVIIKFLIIKPSPKFSMTILFPIISFVLLLTLLYIIGYQIFQFEKIDDIIINAYYNQMYGMNIIKRLSFWYDFIFSSGFHLIGTMGKPVNFYLSKKMNFAGYVNPHNSYVFLLYNTGLITMIIFFTIIIKTIKKNILILQKQKNEMLQSLSYITIGLALFAFTTPMLELSYQGPFFWIFLNLSIKARQGFNK